MAVRRQYTALQIDQLRDHGRHAIGDGLYLEIDSSGKRWLLRYQLKGKRTWFGLGGYHKKTNTLSLARQKASEAKLLVSKGLHPTEENKAEKLAAEAIASQKKLEASAKKHTFSYVAGLYIDSKRSGWRNAKHASQWINSLNAHAINVIGDKPVRDITVEDVRACLDPIWEDKTETASRLRGRIEAILNYAQVNGWREAGLNPATWRGHLAEIYVAPEQIKRNKRIAAGEDGHHPALHYAELPEFYQRLTEQAGLAAKALQLTILTAVRTGSVRFAQWKQFDLDNALWTIPAGNMKSGEEFRVPLTAEALNLLEQMPRLDNWVFAGGKLGKPLSDGAMLSLLKRMKRTDITVHGFRSTFRDWAGEETNYPTHLAELALAHKVGSEVERAYARSDLLDKRRALMADWSAFVTSEMKLQ